MILKRRHFRNADGKRMCAELHQWFAEHGLDYRQFLLHGIDADIIRATGDARAEQVIAYAEAEHGQK